jgi:erythromycin esterase
MAAATGGDGARVKRIRLWQIALIALGLLSAALLPRLPWNQVATPPRPQPSQTLLDDKALQREGDLPAVKSTWRDDVLARHQPIRSLFSDDFSDLQFLKPLLKDKRIVQLGESSHGVAEYNWLKVRLVKFLHKEMGFDVLAFESSLPECEYANRQMESMTASQLVNSCLFAVWQTQEVLPLFEYLKQQRKAGSALTLTGVDTQGSGSGWPDTKRLFVDALKTANQQQADAAGALEDKFIAWFKRGQFEMDHETLSAGYEALVSELQAALAQPGSADGERRADLLLALQSARSRARYVQQLSFDKSNPGRSYEIRDKGMAENLEFLLDQRYPGRKFLVWAHNLHVGVNFPTRQNYKSMATHVAEKRKHEMYTIGFFMGQGVQSMSGKPARFDARQENGFETVLASANRKMSFVDFSQTKPAAGSEWISSSLPARDWGVKPITLIPNQVFDGVVYIDVVTPPEYLK